ncbi:Uma2 family endonuclease [Insulibacter thermoxylanivorax]|nr:Uma2 family endonuclease [Insulibacter thermoxylanivorax]
MSNPNHHDNLLGKKKDTYARCAVPEYWVADPFEKAIRKYVLVGGTYQETDNSRLFPDLQVQLLDSDKG